MTIPYRLAALIHALEAAGHGPVCPAGDELRCRCPAHDDRSPSLYLRLLPDRVLVRCAAGCTGEAVCDAIDFHVADLFLDDNDPVVGAPPADSGTPLTITVDGPATAATPPDAGRPGDVRNEVYSSLLDILGLSTGHDDALKRRGLSPASFGANRYRTAEPGAVRDAVDALVGTVSADQCAGVPGFSAAGGRVTAHVPSGLVIPVRTPGGGITALKVRRDDGGAGPKYVWVSTPGNSCGNPAHVPLGVSKPCPVVRLTEGELKADVATALSGVPTISAPGVTNWAAAVPVLRELGAKTVLLAMDRDGKHATLAATEKAMYGLAKEGFEVELEVWDGARGKGIDDLLAGGGTPDVLTGLAAALRVRDELAAPKADTPAERDHEPAPFPVDVLPPKLADYVAEVAAATSTPPDFAGVALLVVAASAAGNSRALEVKPNAWAEGPRFYAACVGDPASGKTPAMDLVARPYQAMQQKLLDAFRAEKAAHDRAAAAARAAS